MRGEERRVEVPDHGTLRRALGPDLLPGLGESDRDGPELDRGGGLDRSPGRGHRGHRTEQLLFLLHGGQVGQAVRAVGDGHAEMGKDHARIVGVPVDPALGHGLGHRQRQPHPIGQFGQEGGAGVGDKVLPVGDHLGSTDRSTTVHLQGALRFWFECVVLRQTFSQLRQGFYGTRAR